MTRYLVVIAIGPVQEFIAAARRTADLYAGSQLLAKVVGAAAGVFHQSERIFPVGLEGGGANKILAVVEVADADAARKRAEAAERAARAKLVEIWNDHRGRAAEMLEPNRAGAQLEGFLEVYCTWTPENGDYDAARRRVDSLLSGRKALRDFEQTAGDDEGIPKSPLDPALATALALPKGTLSVPESWRNKEPLRLKGSEVLDAVSILKRLYGKMREDDVPSTHDLAHLGATAEAKAKSRFRPSREVGDDPENKPAYSYFAVLLADGDNMGRLLSANGELEQHRQFSEHLDAFAAEAKTIVHNCDGFPVYAGGDDVLALLPVSTALECGQKISKVFREHLEDFRTDNVRPSLSAGIAIVHYREPLSTSLAQARAAEKKAKAVDGKDAVCIALHTRGGGPLSVAQKWAEVKRIQDFVDDDLPRGLPHELRELARKWPEGFDAPLLTAEAQRIADRKLKQDGSKANFQVSNLSGLGDLTTLSEQLILARFLSGKGEA